MTTQHLQWQDYAEWFAKISMSVLMLYGGYAVVERYSLGGVGQTMFWLTYPPLMYWVVIREIHIPRTEKPVPPTGSLRIVFALQGNGFGTHEQREAIHRLTDKLDTILNASGGGKFDGDEFGAGECSLYMYGDDPEAIYESISATLKMSQIVSGGRVEFRSHSSSTPYRTIPL
jgi:hypothetical protein